MGETRFSINHIDGYSVIDEPCTIVAKVTYSVKYRNIYRHDGHNRWIIPLRVVSKDNLEAIKTMTEIGDVFYSDVSKLLVSGALWENQIKSDEDMPTKGERVIATFEYVDHILRCTNITLIPRKQPKIFLSEVYLAELFLEFDELIDDIE